MCGTPILIGDSASSSLTNSSADSIIWPPPSELADVARVLHGRVDVIAVLVRVAIPLQAHRVLPCTRSTQIPPGLPCRATSRCRLPTLSTCARQHATGECTWVRTCDRVLEAVGNDNTLGRQTACQSGESSHRRRSSPSALGTRAGRPVRAQFFGCAWLRQPRRVHQAHPPDYFP